VKNLEELMSRQDVPVIQADQEGFIVAVNEAFSSAFGWRREDLDGRLLSTIMPVAFRDAHQLGLSRFVLTEAPKILEQPLELEVLTRSGEVRPAEHYIVAEKVSGKWVFVARVLPGSPKA